MAIISTEIVSESIVQTRSRENLSDQETADWRMSVTDHRNWDEYHRAFSHFFEWVDGDLADPERFPKGERPKRIKYLYKFIVLTKRFGADSRDKNGFWVPFKVFEVYGYFECPVDEDNSGSLMTSKWI